MDVNEFIEKYIDQLNVRYLLHVVFEWAYKNDKRLYKNLDDCFSAFDCRNSSIDECKKLAKKEKVTYDNLKPIPVLIQALTKTDYGDTIKFRQTFIQRGSNSYIEDYQYVVYSNKQPNSEEHPYLEVVPHIDKRLKELKNTGLDSFRKSDDVSKNEHFRWWINNLLNNEKHYRLRLFPENDTNCFDTLYVGSKEDQEFNAILQYILDNHIIPDPHKKEIQVPDFLNPDHYNPRYLKNSCREGGFRYLVYLTAKELNEIYASKLSKSKISVLQKPLWAYINSHVRSKNEQLEDTKFHLFIY